ncbi:MAG: ABC transporter permease [Thermoanaerobaculia bacterium]|nr:ABC transporter permease [Thermoanaerobaculia bacterium]
MNMAALVTDFLYAVRALRKNASLVCLSVAIIGLGAGACTAVFSLLNPLLLRELPFEEPERLVWVANSGEAGSMSGVTSRTSNLRDFRVMNHTFEAITGYFAFFEHQSYNFTAGGEPERLVGVPVARDFLEVLGVETIHGRNFVAEEAAWGGRPAVILSHGFFTRSFGADPGVVGRSIVLNDEPREVVGVLPPSFDFASIFAPHTSIDFLSPFPITDETDRWGNTLSMIGRLHPDQTAAASQADLDAVVARLEEADPSRWGLGAVVTGLQDQIAGPFRIAGFLLSAAAGAVMLIVSVNLSNLLLAQGSRRRREMAVRGALGASRLRLIRQLLFESLILSVCGSIVGLGIAWSLIRFVTSSPVLTVPLLQKATLDGVTLGFAALLSLLVTGLVGLIPALRATRREAASTRTEGRSQSADRGATRLRAALVVAEVTLACVLLVVGGLLLRSFQNVLDVDLGFQTTDVLRWQINSSRSFETAEQRSAYFAQLTDRVEQVPGVVSVGLTDAAPLGPNRTWGVSAPGYEYDGNPTLGMFVHIVDEGYVPTLDIQLLRGRSLSRDDQADRPQVALLNESAAQAVFHGEDALGRSIRIGEREVEVVGVVANIRHRSLEEGSGPQMYLSMAQVPDDGTLDLVVRTSLSPTTVAPGVRTAIRAHDPTLPVHSHQSLDNVVEQAVSPRKFTLQILGSFAACALFLAVLGIYGVQSYAVSERVREIGIRMALGETNLEILWRVLGRSMLLASTGLVCGLGLSLLVSRSTKSLLFGVTPFDLRTFLAMALLLLAVSALAGLLPAWRAARTSPASVLRST